MTRPTHIRKRDGRVVPFDEGKIADAIYRAALAVGGEDRFLAEELASVVTLFLGKMLGARGASPGANPPTSSSPSPSPSPSSEADNPALPGMEAAGPSASAPPPVPPTIEQVQDVVEKVLIETGHARTAKAYILHRDRRSRLREAAAARLSDSPPTLFDDRLLIIDDPALERSGAFASDRLVRAVAAETGIETAAASSVVQGVEERLRRAGVRRLPAPLLTSLVDAELLDRGLLDDPRRRSGVSLSRHVIEAALIPRGRPGLAVPPEEAARRLGGEALRSWALAEVLPGDVARGHLEGRFHVHGLSRPAALHSASLSLDALKLEGVPGAGGRRPARAMAGAARFLAQAGRAVGAMRGYVTHGVGISSANLLLAPLLVRDGRDVADPAAFAEDAEQLLLEVSGGADGVPVDLDLCASVPAALASAPALGGPEGTILGDHGQASLSLARALVAARIGAEGLPPRGHLPRLHVIVDRDGLAAPGSRALLREALAGALQGAPVRLVLQRDGALVAGAAAAREVVCGDGEAFDPARLRPFCVQRVTLNLPRAAFRSPPGDLTGFFRECDGAVDLALEAHHVRRSLLASVATGSGGALTPLFRQGRSGGRAAPPPLDLADGSYSVGILGLNEAVAHLLGEEFHESDAAVKVGARILAYLSLKVHEAGRERGLRVRLDASTSSRAARRFRDLDRSEHRVDQERVLGGHRRYTGGVSVREGAPADLLRRLEREGRLHSSLDTAVFSYDPAADEGVSEEGLLALVEKVFLHTPVHVLAVGEGA